MYGEAGRGGKRTVCKVGSPIQVTNPPGRLNEPPGLMQLHSKGRQQNPLKTSKPVWFVLTTLEDDPASEWSLNRGPDAGAAPVRHRQESARNVPGKDHAAQAGGAGHVRG